MPAHAKPKADQDDGARPRSEVKLLLVGQPDAGKTSLARRLVDGDFDPHERSTHGLQRRTWDLAASGEPVRVHVWDFGGQEIWHATHQFFLTKRSLYLIVVDARLDDAEARIAYWMKLVETFGPGSPVLVVCNKTDQRRVHLPEDKLRRRYPLIAGFHETSCETEDGIPALAAAIEAQIAAIARARPPIPAPWLAIQRKLESKKRPYLKRDELDAICAEHGVATADERRRLVETLCDVGTIVSFHDTWLEDTTVLDPTWITTGVYGIVGCAQRPDRRGVFQVDDLARALDPAAYPPDAQRFLVDMMLTFELMFPFDAPAAPSRYLLPGLLPEEAVEAGTFEGAATFAYTYTVLFDAIVSRLLVRTYGWIATGTCSRRGAVLVKDGCRARVQADREDRTIEIRVVGPDAAAKCAFLAEIRGHLEHINGLYQPAVAATPNVVWSDAAGHRALFPYDDLLTKERIGIASDVVPGTEIPVRVRDVLALVRPEPPAPEAAPGAEPAARTPWPAIVFLVLAPLTLLLGAAAAVKIAGGPAAPYLAVAGPLAIVSIVSFLRYEKKVTQKTYGAIVGGALKALVPLARAKSAAAGRDGAAPRLPAHFPVKRLDSQPSNASKSTAAKGKR